MYHMRKATAAEWSAWAAIPASDLDPSTPRAATAQELLNRSVVVAHTDPATGDVFFHCGALHEPAPGEFPGVAITPTSGPECYLRPRHRALAAEHRARFHHARVFRSVDGSSLRESCEQAVAGRLAARTPATGRTSSQPADPVGAADVLSEAARRAAPEVAPDGTVVRAATARQLSIAMAEVHAGDVVEEDGLFGHRWAGEPEE